MVATSLLAILVCPDCRHTLSEVAQFPNELVCASCALGFPVVEGIPVLLLDQAQARS
ncbi:MAG: Trm112 family protein [Actinomycetes bacterium]